MLSKLIETRNMKVCIWLLPGKSAWEESSLEGGSLLFSMCSVQHPAEHEMSLTLCLKISRYELWMRAIKWMRAFTFASGLELQVL